MVLLALFFKAWKPQLPFNVIALKKKKIASINLNFSFCVPQKQAVSVWNNMRVCKWWHNFQFWVNNAFKLSSDILENVSCSCKMLSTGFPRGLCLQVIESMWTISWLCNDDTERLQRRDESNDILMHVPACVGVQGETSSESGQVGRKLISWVTFLVGAIGTAASVIIKNSYFLKDLFYESQQTNYKGWKKLHFSRHWTAITICMKASKCLFKVLLLLTWQGVLKGSIHQVWSWKNIAQWIAVNYRPGCGKNRARYTVLIGWNILYWFFFFKQVFYLYFEFCITLHCVLELTEISLN